MSYYAEPHVLEVQPEPKDLGSFLDIVVEERSKIYCYDVQIDDDVAYDDVVDQALETLNWEANRQVVDLVFSATGHLRRDSNFYYVYDGQTKMYTNQKHGLPEIYENGRHKAIYELHAGVPLEDMITPPLIRDRANEHAADPEIPPFVRRFFRCNEVMVTFTSAGEIDMAKIGDALSRERGSKVLNDKLRAFFYWLMVESVFESTANRTHYPSGWNTIFATANKGRETIVDNIFAIREGLFLEPRITGKPDNVSTLLAAQPQYAAFYIEQSLAECWEKLMSNDALRFEFDTFFRGVRCKLEHDETLSVVVEGLTSKNLSELNARDENGDPIPMAQVFREQYSRLRGDRPAVRVRLHWPSAERKYGTTVVREFAAYPLEALIIMPNQRVPLRQMSHTLAEHVIKKNLEARRDYMTLKRLLGSALFSTSAINTLRAFGVTVPNAPKFFTITPLQHMSVAYWTNMSRKIKNADWNAEARGLKYFRPSVIPLLRIVVDNDVRHRHQNVDASVTKFRKELLENARAKEVQIQRSEIVFVDGIPGLLQSAKDDFKDVSLVIYVDEDFQLHGTIKLWERVYETPTLHVTFGAVSQRTRSDLDKIVAKSNVKTGGLCYKPLIRALVTKPPVFIMGLALTVTQPVTNMQRSALNKTPSAVAVPEQNALPSVIGVCANRAMDAFTYSGDYDFQEGFNGGVIEPSRLTNVTKWAFGQFLKNSGNCQPPAIVFRYCQSESQFAKILAEERSHIEKGFVEAGYMPKYALVLLTNEHAKHYWPHDAATAAESVPGQAVGPGPAVFKGDQREFFMRPYRYDTVRNEKKKCDEKVPAMFTQYLLAYNTTGFSPEQLRDIAYGLCYSRQSTPFPTQLPEPVHRAHQIATRGRSNLEEYNELVNPVNANNLDAVRNALYYREAQNQELVNQCFTA